VAAEATAEGPARRRTSWSLKTIVEDVAGRPVEELQDPTKSTHPYFSGERALRPTAPRRAGVAAAEPPYDPVDRFSPPLVGSAGRAAHGKRYEHDQETLARHATPTAVPSTSPFHRPERIYLHYLLLHMDRLGASALVYLRNAIDEELAHRAATAPPPPPDPRKVIAPDP
jgi:hypothetical protein